MHSSLSLLDNYVSFCKLRDGLAVFRIIIESDQFLQPPEAKETMQPSQMAELSTRTVLDLTRATSISSLAVLFLFILSILKYSVIGEK